MIRQPKQSNLRDDQGRHKLMQQLIQNLKNANNFGYKLIQKQQYGILSNWYSSIHGRKIVLDEQTTQFFAKSTVMFGYLVLGLTSEGDRVLSTDLIPSSIKTTINNLNRTLITLQSTKMLFGSNTEVQVQNFLTQFQNKIKECKLFIVSNPDTISMQSWPQQILTRFLQICKKYDVYVILDERKADFYPQFHTMLGSNEKNLIIVRQIGSMVENEGLKKNICIFGSSELKKKRIPSTSAKSLKVLPGDLTIHLIQVFMGKEALQIHKAVMKNMEQNYQSLQKLLKIHDPAKQLKLGKGSYLIINKNQIQSKGLLNEMLKVQLFQDMGSQNTKLKDYLRIDLKLPSTLLQNKIKSLQNLIPSPKL